MDARRRDGFTPSTQRRSLGAMGRLNRSLPRETMAGPTEGAGMDDIRFQLLGPMGILVDGVAAKLPGVGERALLVQLFLAPGRTIPATLLVDRLWSEANLPVDPMNALQIRVSKLRRALRGMGLDELVTRTCLGYRACIDPSKVHPLDFVARIR